MGFEKALFLTAAVVAHIALAVAVFFAARWVWRGHAWRWLLGKVSDVSGAVRGERR